MIAPFVFESRLTVEPLRLALKGVFASGMDHSSRSVFLPCDWPSDFALLTEFPYQSGNCARMATPWTCRTTRRHSNRSRQSRAPARARERSPVADGGVQQQDSESPGPAPQTPQTQPGNHTNFGATGSRARSANTVMIVRIIFSSLRWQPASGSRRCGESRAGPCKCRPCRAARVRDRIDRCRP